MKRKLILISALLFFSSNTWSLTSDGHSRLQGNNLVPPIFNCNGSYSRGEQVRKRTLQKIKKELRCLDQEVLHRDFERIFDLKILSKQQTITIIRDTSKNPKEYKEKIFYELTITTPTPGGYFQAAAYKVNKKSLPSNIRMALINSMARKEVLHNIAIKACQLAYGSVDNQEGYNPIFRKIRSQQIDSPIIKKSGLIDDFRTIKYTFKIYDFEASYLCRTNKERKQEIRRVSIEKEKLKQEEIARTKEAEEKNKLAELEKKKSLCREIGAEDNSSDMIMCVTRLMEIEKMSEIADENKQQAIADRNRVLNEIARTNEQIRKDEQARRQGQALMNLGAAISGGGTTGSPSSIPSIIPTPPVSQPRYSKTLTVDSNKNCPILVDALVKQEVFGLNRICYYR